MQEKVFTTHDGVSLFYRYFPSKSGATDKAIVLFHRGHEHSARMTHLVDELSLDDYAFFAWDARGHGNSPGERGFSPSLGTTVRDVQTFVQHIQEAYHIAPENMAVIAQSVGAVVVATWVHDYAPKIRCLVLASPAFKVKLYVPFARTGLAIMRKLRGHFYVNSYVKAKFLTHDPERIASYNSDSKISRPISVNILLSLYTTAERIVADAQAITVPTQLLISGADWVVHHAPQHRFFANLGAKTKEKHVLEGFFHDTLGEKDRHLAVAKVKTFIQTQFSKPYQEVDLTQAHLQGATKQEADKLAKPLSALSPCAWYWGITRAWLRVGAYLSQGLKIGRDLGFDSGSTLDYVYRNQAQGCTFLGKLIDRQYLNAIGWRGIRQRKVHLEELLRSTIQKLRQQGQAVHIVDIAAGHGRYVLEAIQAGGVQPDSIHLRDYSPVNVAAGQALIAEKGLQSIARFSQADAFNRQSIAESDPKPTLGIVSGLYELFPDNALLEQSLAGLADAIPSGGYLVYTGQPWHPQLAFIARALTSHRQGQAWVMRRRTQQEMDQLVERAGFRKLEQRIDEWGIFTVSVAQKM